MSKSVKGTLASDKLIMVAKNRRSVRLLDYPNVEANAIIRAKEVFLEQDYENNNRPYLRMRSEIRSLHTKDNDESFPFDITEIELGSGNRSLPVELYYSFTDAQIADLAAKGYFTKESLSIPSVIKDTDLEIDVMADFKIVDDGNILSTVDKEEQPIIFVEIQNKFHYDISLENTGYDFAEVFEPSNAAIANTYRDVKVLDEPDYDMLELDSKDVIKSEFVEDYNKLMEESKDVNDIRPVKPKVQKSVDPNVVVDQDVDKTYDEMIKGLDETQEFNYDNEVNEKSTEVSESEDVKRETNEGLDFATDNKDAIIAQLQAQIEQYKQTEQNTKAQLEDLMKVQDELLAKQKQDKIKDEKEYESDKKTHELELDDFEEEENEENTIDSKDAEDSDHVLDEQLKASYDAVDDDIDLSNVEVDPDDFLDTVDLDALNDLEDLDK